MSTWQQYPLLRILFPFLAGIMSGILTGTDISFPLLPVISAFFLFFCVMVFTRSPKSYKYRWLSGILIYILILSLAYDITITKQSMSDVPSLGVPLKKKCIFLADVIEPVIRREKSVKAIVRLRSVRNNGKWYPSERHLLTYFQKDKWSSEIMYGDRLLIYTLMTEPSDPANPGAYDFKRFLKYKGIHFQSYVSSGQWISLGREGQNPVIRYALLIRDRLLQILRDNKLEGREFAVAAALLLGYTDEIDRQLMKDYSSTGAMHILSVSGMHVGIIFIVLDRLLGFLGRKRGGMVMKTTVIIVVIWFYAFITGLSPAVLRAAAMLSFVVLGNAMKRNPDILNILAASMILLLLWNPLLIMDAGFQLSYLAVAGIVLLYKPVYDLYLTSQWIPDKIWSIVALSVAAQIATFPLSLYYFHQFPNYFMITNILVVPLSSLVIYAGILLLFFGSVPFLSLVLAKTLTGLVWFLNSSIHFIEGLPFSVTRGKFITVPETILLYMVIILLALFLAMKGKRFLYMLLVFTCFLAASFSIRNFRQSQQKKLVVFSMKNASAIDFINNRSSILLYSGNVQGNEAMEEVLQNHWQAGGIDNKLKIFLHPSINNEKVFLYNRNFYKRGNFIGFHGKRIGIITRSFISHNCPLVKLDLIIISGNPQVTLSELQKLFEPDEVVIDLSNPSWRSRKWKEEAKRLGMKCHAVAGSGAYIAEF